uniref:Uncharacterized protein n=1 Tax=Panagrolaimus sp. ES5 TaxID=591445 RepID=A0AC34FWZ7_9BILA
MLLNAFSNRNNKTKLTTNPFDEIDDFDPTHEEDEQETFVVAEQEMDVTDSLGDNSKFDEAEEEEESAAKESVVDSDGEKYVNL